MAKGPPIHVINQNTQRQSGRKAQLANVAAAKAVADIIRTTLGPRSMLKMILDPMGGIVMTNDGNAILREVDVSHPAARSMIELSRAQDEEVGDGTTSVIILAGEMMKVAVPFLEQNMHPTIIVGAYQKALDDALTAIDGFAQPLDVTNHDALMSIVRSTLGTKFVSQTGNFGEAMCELAIEAVKRVTITAADGSVEIDTKRYARVEKIPGGDLEDCKVLDGLMLNKDVTHPRMSRRIEKPRILLLDCPLEYKKGESQTNIEMTQGSDWEAILRQEEEEILKMCNAIIELKPDIVFTEKGVSDLAQHYLMKANISVIRRLRKTDNNRIARATGARIGHRTEGLTEEDIGTNCGLFEVRKIGDNYWSFIEDCKDAKACTVVLRGASKDVLTSIELNLQDAMGVVKNILADPRMLPGGGATEMALSWHLQQKAKTIDGVSAFPYKAVASALEVIPRTLIENCGGQMIRLVTALRAKHAAGADNFTWGIDGNKGKLADMVELGVWEPFAVKSQTIKTAIESATLLLRIDDIVAAVTNKPGSKQHPAGLM